MNDSEWTQCKAAIFRTFPTLSVWAGGLSAAVRSAIDERWKRTLGRETLQDALVAIEKASLASESPWPFASDYERAGAILADIVRRSKPAESDLDERAMSRKRRGSSYSADGTYAKVLRAIDEHAGHSDECRRFRVVSGRCLPTCPVPGEVGRQLAAECVGLASDRQVFDCGLCRDSGYVACYASRDVYWIATLERLPSIPKTYAVRCNCRHGQDRKRDDRFPDYDAELDVALCLSPKAVITTCVAICERISERGKVHGGGGRVGVFDDFNEHGTEASLALG